MEEDNFAIGALGVCGVLEGIEYFFECEEFAGFDLVDFPDVTVGATADFFEEFVAGKDVRFDVFSHVSERKYLKMEFKIS
jgi:hypothetical protein